MTSVSRCQSDVCFCCSDSDAAHQRPSVCCNVIWLGASFLQSGIQVQSQRPAVQCLTFTTWPLRPPILCQIDTAKMHFDYDSSKHDAPERFFFFLVHALACFLWEHLQSHPTHQCAAPPFWPSCYWSPGRTGLYAGKRRQPPPPVQPLLYRPTAGSHRSQRPAVWSPRAMYSFSERKND